MRKILTIGAGLAIALAVMFLASPTQAVTKPLTIANVTTSSTTSSATGVTLTLSIMINQEIPDGYNLGFHSYLNGPCYNFSCEHDFSNATVSGLAGDLSKYANMVNVHLSGAIPVGPITVTIGNVVNPVQAGSYNITGDLNGMMIDPDVSLLLGDIALVGQIKMPDGTPASNASLNIHTQDYSVNYGGPTDSNGRFAIPVNFGNGTFVSGTTYLIDLWPPQGVDGIVPPDTVSFIYSGTTVTKNISFVAASKTINVTVKYDNGSPVTNANVWANKRGGGSNIGGTVNFSGVKTLTVSGGSWDVGINCPWNQETNSQGNCDWAYNQPPTAVEFAPDSTAEIQSFTFTVIKATAIIKGKIIKPDGSPMQGGGINIQKDGGMGLGTGLGQDGSFSANVPAGNYKVSFSPNPDDPTLSRYYTAPISVSVGDNETRDLGTMTVQLKTSLITGKVALEDGTGVSGVRLNAWVMSGSGWGNATSGADGTFSLYVSPGDWQVNVDNGSQTSNYIPMDNKGIPLTVGNNQTVSAGTIYVKLADATLKVKLVDINGNAISNMFGYAYARKKGAGFGPGSEFGNGINQGTATIKLVGGSTFTVGANMPPDSGVGYSLKEEVEVAVGVGETKTVKLTLVPNDSVISGFVKDQNGQLVKNLDAEVFVNDDSWQWRSTRLQPDGTFTISVRGGKKYMTGVNVRGNNAYVATNPKPEDAFVVPANTTFTKIVTLLKADSVINGVVLKPDGSPMAHAWVNANNYRSMENQIKGDVAGARIVDTGTETNAGGQFQLAVVAGKYDVHAGMPPEFTGNFMPPKEVSVDVNPTAPATGVVLQFRAADATAAVTLLLPDGSKPEMGFCHAWSEQGGNSGKEAFGGVSNVPLTTGSWYIGCDSYNPKTDKFYRSDDTLVSVTKGKTATMTVKLKEGLFNIPKGVTETFDATTQKSLTLPDGTVVTIPANALGSSGNVTLIASPDVNLFHTKDTKPINFAWDFEALDSNNALVTTFNSNVTICIQYDIDYLNKIGVSENSIVAKYYNSTNGTWQLPEGTTQDFVSHKVCFSVSHFTNFALATGSQVSATAGGPQYIVATPSSQGGPQVTIWDGNGNRKLSFFAFDSRWRLGMQVAYGDVNGDGENEIIVVPGKRFGPMVRVFNLQGQLLNQFFVFAASLRSGVNLTVADVDGDGMSDIIVAPMDGAGPQVRIFDGSGQVKSQFMAYATSFRGGVNLTTGDINGDGALEIITAPMKASAPHIRTFTYTGMVVSQFFAYATTIRGGYHITTGDVDNNGSADIVVTPTAGLGPQVAEFTGSGELIKRFMAYASTFRGGLYVSVGDVNSDGANEIVATPESQAGPQVRVFNYEGTALSQFFAYASRLRGSFTSFVADVNSDGTSEIVTAPGAGMGPQVRIFDSTGKALNQFFTLLPSFRGGMNITTVPAY